MRLLLSALLVGAAAGWIGGGADAGAAPAPSGTLVASPRFVPVAGPLVAGPDRLVWVRRRDDAVLDLWVSEPGRGARLVQRFSGADGERLRQPRLAASRDAVSLELRVSDRRRRTLRHYHGPFGEPLTAGAEIALRPIADPWPGHAVVVTRGCASAEIRAVASEDVATAPVPASECRLRLRRAPRPVRDRLRLGVSCAGFRIDCSAWVTVRAKGRVIARGPARYNHATPPYAAASLRLGALGRKLLRRPQRVRVTARIVDPSLGKAVTRHMTAQLPAARR